MVFAKFALPDLSKMLGAIVAAKEPLGDTFMYLRIICLILALIDLPILIIWMKIHSKNNHKISKSLLINIMSLFRLVPLLNLISIGLTDIFSSVEYLSIWLTIFLFPLLFIYPIMLMALVGNKIKPFKRPFNYGVKFLVEIMVWITMFFMNAGLWGILVTTDILPSFNNSGKIVPDFIISVFLILILYLPMK